MADPDPRPPAAFDPAALDKLGKLALVARTVVDGYMAGQQVSPHRGSSIEFAQHREYVAGDDPRFVDEKIYARTNRLVVKEFVEETNLACHLLVDGSASMGFASQASPSGVPRTKLLYASWCAAALAHLVLRRRDVAGLVLFDQRERTKVPPKNGAEQAAAILRVLEAAQPSGSTAVGASLDWLVTRLRRRGIVCVFSDFFEDPDQILAGVERLRLAGHEPILFEVLDPAELRFDYRGHLRLDDLEGGPALKIDAQSVREAYLEELERHRSGLRRRAAALGVDWVELSTDTPLDVALSAYLNRRLAVRRGGRMRLPGGPG